MQCFVAGTPVLVPLADGDEAVPPTGGLVAAGILPPEEPTLGEVWWRIPAGLELAALAVSGWVWEKAREISGLISHYKRAKAFDDVRTKKRTLGESQQGDV